jgi:tryptophanyl-tRNA synthetase
MKLKELLADNEKLVNQFGAQPLSKLKDLPDFYTFKRGLIYSHRDFDKFFTALKKGEKCAILSGLNASGNFHIGHKAVFDTNLFFQKEYGIPVFIPISDDESYVSGKVETQEEGLKNSLELAKELIAYGFDPKKTFFIIDQIYTNIYNLAIKLSKRVTLSEIKATYGYKPEDNPGLYFYPIIQSAHILFPQTLGYKNVLVPIGPDEDGHIRISRDIAGRAGFNRPSILHITFLPGVDAEKMSKSKNNAIFLKNDKKTIEKKAKKAFSGGAVTAEEQRKNGGDPENDIACMYLTKIFLDEKEGEQLAKDYRAGKLLSGEVKMKLADELVKFTGDFQSKLRKITIKDIDKCILRNEDFSL